MTSHAKRLDSLVLLLLGGALSLLAGCAPSSPQDALKIEAACAQISQKYPVSGGAAAHQAIPAQEWPHAIQSQHPVTVEIFDGAVWLYAQRSTGKVTQGLVYCPNGLPQEGTAVIHYKPTRAPHLYTFVWQP